MLSWPHKDPSDVLDYGIDWTSALNTGDTIASVDWSASPDGLTFGSQSLDGSLAAVWISGGVSGTTYSVTCRATTAGGRQMDRSARLFVIDR